MLTRRSSRTAGGVAAVDDKRAASHGLAASCEQEDERLRDLVLCARAAERQTARIGGGLQSSVLNFIYDFRIQ